MVNLFIHFPKSYSSFLLASLKYLFLETLILIRGTIPLQIARFFYLDLFDYFCSFP